VRAGVQAEAAPRQFVDAQAPALRELRIVVRKVRRGAAHINDERADSRRLVLATRGARMNGGDNENKTRGDRDPQQVGRNCTWAARIVELDPAVARGTSHELRRGRLPSRGRHLA